MAILSSSPSLGKCPPTKTKQFYTHQYGFALSCILPETVISVLTSQTVIYWFSSPLILSFHICFKFLYFLTLFLEYRYEIILNKNKEEIYKNS